MVVSTVAHDRALGPDFTAETAIFPLRPDGTVRDFTPLFAQTHGWRPDPTTLEAAHARICDAVRAGTLPLTPVWNAVDDATPPSPASSTET